MPVWVAATLLPANSKWAFRLRRLPAAATQYPILTEPTAALAFPLSHEPTTVRDRESATTITIIIFRHRRRRARAATIAAEIA